MRTPGDADVQRELLGLERALAERDGSQVPGGLPGGLQSLLTEDFLEFGSSGRQWDRESTIRELLPSAAGRVEIDRFAIRRLAEDAVLATYELTVPRPEGRRRSLRSSIWVRRDGRWQMSFHQGTPVP